MIDEVLGALELFAPGVDVQAAWQDSNRRLPLIIMMVGIGVAAFAGARLRIGGAESIAPGADSTLKEVEDDVIQD